MKKLLLDFVCWAELVATLLISADCFIMFLGSYNYQVDPSFAWPNMMNHIYFLYWAIIIFAVGMIIQYGIIKMIRKIYAT